MHELSLAGDLISLCQDVLKKNAGTRVSRVNLQLGSLAGVVADSLEFCFNIVKAGTPLAEAELVIILVPIELKCKQCGMLEIIEEFPWLCGNCGSRHYELHRGREFLVDSLDID